MAKNDGMIGKRFGNWTVLEIDTDYKGKSTNRFYICRCDCGTVRSVCGYKLRNGHTKSCGCMAGRRVHAKYLYMKTTTDEYELPLAVSESPTEIGKAFGIKPNSVIVMATRKENGWLRIPAGDDSNEQ